MQPRIFLFLFLLANCPLHSEKFNKEQVRIEPPNDPFTAPRPCGKLARFTHSGTNYVCEQKGPNFFYFYPEAGKSGDHYRLKEKVFSNVSHPITAESVLQLDRAQQDVFIENQKAKRELFAAVALKMQSASLD